MARPSKNPHKLPLKVIVPAAALDEVGEDGLIDAVKKAVEAHRANLARLAGLDNEIGKMEQRRDELTRECARLDALAEEARALLEQEQRNREAYVRELEKRMKPEEASALLEAKRAKLRNALDRLQVTVRNIEAGVI